MKKVLLLLLFIPIVSFGQYVPTQNQYEVKEKTEKR